MADVLKDEVINDPLGIGYAAMTAVQVADSLNAPTRNRNRTSMTGREVADEVVDAEYDALTDVKKSQFLSLMAGENLDPFGLPANVIKDVFGAGSATVLALATARVEVVSRAKELGLGFIWPGNVENARL